MADYEGRSELMYIWLTRGHRLFSCPLDKTAIIVTAVLCSQYRIYFSSADNSIHIVFQGLIILVIIFGIWRYRRKAQRARDAAEGVEEGKEIA